MRVSAIVAASENGVIGRGNQLPWHLPADLRRFKALTMGHHLLMGRRTWDSVGKPLPGRPIVVISRRKISLPEGVHLVASPKAAIELARTAGESEAFLAGGAEIYRLALAEDLIDRVYLTRIHQSFEGDATFPELASERWQLVERQDCPADERNPYDFSYLTYDRAR
jgi:dihydrofolate reductase